MRAIIFGAVAAAGLIVGLSSAASAAPVRPVVGPDTAVAGSQVQPVYYMHAGRRFRHRRWDQRGRRWRYWN